MIYLIHGTDISQSRRFLQALKNKSKTSQINIIAGEGNFDFRTTILSLSNNALFGDQIVNIVEFEKSPKIEGVENIKFLGKLNYELILWIGEAMPKTNILLKYAEYNEKFAVKSFNKKNTNLAFACVDALNARDPAVLNILNNVKDPEVPLVLGYIAQNFRTMLGLKLGSRFANKVHPFVKKKILQHEKKFSKGKIIEILQKIYDLDIKFKTTTKDIKTDLFVLSYYIIS